MNTPVKLPPIPRMAAIGPFKVPVILVTPKGLARKLKCRVGAAAGGWTPTPGRIYIDKTLDLERQWDIYWHELGHAVMDLQAIFKGGL